MAVTESEATAASKRVRAQVATPVRCAVLNDPADVEALRAEWRDLHATCGDASYMTSFEWCMTAWHHIAKPRGRRLAVVAAWRGDRLVLVWPLVLVRVGPWTLAQKLGAEAHDPAEVLIAHGEDAEALFDNALAAVRRVADALRFAFVHQDSPLFGLLGDRVTENAVTITQVPAITLDHWSDMEGWRASLGPDSRRNLHRGWRKLEDHGAVAIELASTPTRVAEGVDFLFRNKLAWCAATGQDPREVADPEHRSFIEVAATAALASGHLVMPLLTIDSAPIAAQLCFRHCGRLTVWMTAYDGAFAKASPGTLLLGEVISWCFARRLAMLEMGPHDHGYKQHWCRQPVPAAERVLMPLTLWGRVFPVARALKHRLRPPKLAR